VKNIDFAKHSEFHEDQHSGSSYSEKLIKLSNLGFQLSNIDGKPSLSDESQKSGVNKHSKSPNEINSVIETVPNMAKKNFKVLWKSLEEIIGHHNDEMEKASKLNIFITAKYYLVRTVLSKSNFVLHNFSGDTKNCFLKNIRHLCEIE
jgi:hypothetical protein